MSGFKCEFQLVEALGLIILWIFLVFITIGLAAFIAPYYLTRAPLNRTYLVDTQGNKLARVHVDSGYRTCCNLAYSELSDVRISLFLLLVCCSPKIDQCVSLSAR